MRVRNGAVGPTVSDPAPFDVPMSTRLRPTPLLVFAALLLASCTAVNPYYDATRPHHRPDGFANNYGPAGGKPFGELLACFGKRVEHGAGRGLWNPRQHLLQVCGIRNSILG